MRAAAQVRPDLLQTRWIWGALGFALLIHALAAWALGWYRIPGMVIPALQPDRTGPFVVKQILVNPDAFKSQQPDPIQKLPAADPPQNPAEFNLDANQVEKALQTPQPMLATPTVPEPAKVIAAADLSQGLPTVENDSALVTAEVAKVDPAMTSGPVTSAKLAEDLISSSSGPAQPGDAAGKPAQGNGNAGKLPGFAELAPSFKPPGVNPNLPEPVLLRLPSDVLFDFDSAQLKPDAGSLLMQAVTLIAKYPQADVHIDGYTDSFGKADYNANLSQQRAESVQAWLQQRITQPAYRFKAQGHGSASFIVSAQGSIQQQQPNRRVEILIQATRP